MKRYTLYFLASALILSSCRPQGETFDAYGHFEADEIIISSEVPGRLLQLSVFEGQKVSKGDTLAIIDTLQLHIQKKQVRASIEAVRMKTLNIQSELAVVEVRRDYLNSEITRFQKLVSQEAATQKQLDDISAERDMVVKQIDAMRIKLTNTNRGILAEIGPMEIKMEQLQDQLDRSIITSPTDGIVLAQYAELSELMMPGRPLCKVADTDVMKLKVYLTASQLSRASVGAPVNVSYPSAEEMLVGEISRIASEAEFTPKNVQTNEEKENLVYATDIRVKNNGFLRIGMPGEMSFRND